jgi:predicted phage terminase large subunit-like protein
MASVQALRLAHDEALRQLCKGSLYFFVKTFWHVVVQQGEFMENWHIEAICDHLQALAEGRLERNRLMIFLPPRHAKSIIVNVFMPAWDWTVRPHRRFVSASAKDNLSTRDAVRARNLVASDLYQRLFGDVCKPHATRWGSSYYQNEQGGSRLPITTSGGTGQDADFLLCDDPLEAQDARSQVKRDSCFFWYDSTFTTRGTKAEKTPLVLVHQRLHEDDIAGRILADEAYARHYDVLCFPALYDPNHPVKTISSLGFQDPRTQEGELLWGERFGEVWVQQEKAKGARHYNSQLQQRPSVADGEIFKEEMFPIADENANAIINGATEVLLSVDATFSDSELSDCVAIIVFARYKGEWYCVNGINKQMDFLATLTSIKQMMNEYRPHSLIIEKKANGDAIIRVLRQHGIDNVLAITPKESKEARAEASTIYLNQGSVKFLDNPFTDSLIDQAIAFPNRKDDDMVDALTQFINAKLNRRQSDVQGISIGF